MALSVTVKIDCCLSEMIFQTENIAINMSYPHYSEIINY